MTQPAPPHANLLDPAASAFGISAIVTILFNTALAIAQDVSPVVHKALEQLAGHHWTAHGLLDVALFCLLGILLWRNGMRRDGVWLAMGLGLAAIVGGGVLTLWFLLV
jgi:hypothetical protein